ncbi:hypothetical protein [Amycolatopsis sp. SID8362]|uniref:hypothetical protein n=1 Tax=Amycolatopsis sp. SID8362 TaxID=2690346 RepID=UPI0013717F1A|nr:hypothetical protein [Amycolatopsis sp. SID8362]NBH03449.1 hypothetical protein [Amycolatopsis sp. SID8362]NED40149.1 hypothetical protein [Amycolatopsis sp. SID8362]
MPAGALSGAKRLFLLCALALGVILMHHLNPPGAMSGTAETVVEHAEPAPAAMALDTGSASPHHACPPCGAHVMTHVCLAILDGMPSILLVLFALAGFPGLGATTAAGLRGTPRPSRSPDLHGRATLTSLCVLRV